MEEETEKQGKGFEKQADDLDELAEYNPKSEFSKPVIAYNAAQKCIEAR